MVVFGVFVDECPFFLWTSSTVPSLLISAPNLPRVPTFVLLLATASQQFSFCLQSTVCSLCGEGPATSLPYRVSTWILLEARQDALPELGCPAVPGPEQDSCAGVQNILPSHSRPRSVEQKRSVHLSESTADLVLESHNFQLNSQLLPTVTSFIPGLPAGAPFRVSIHCWQNPDFSRVLRDLKKAADYVLFEARMFIDGRVVA